MRTQPRSFAPRSSLARSHFFALCAMVRAVALLFALCAMVRAVALLFALCAMVHAVTSSVTRVTPVTER
jgi:hypothetical protein